MKTVAKLLMLGILISISACQDREARRQELEIQRGEITELRQELSTVSAQVHQMRTVVCEYLCESRYNNCDLRVDVNDLYKDIPGRESPRAPGPEIPGCSPFDCESDEEKELAEDNPAQSCTALEERCREDCIAAVE